MMNNEKEKDAIDTSKLDEILPKYDPLKLNSINLAQNYVSAFNTGMNIYQCVNQLQGYIEWVVKAVNDVVKSWNVQVGESIDQSKAIVRETTTEQFNVEWTNKQPELIEQVNTLTTNQFNEDWGVLENRINTTLETQNTNIQNIQNEQNELENNTNNNINAQNTKINTIQTQQTNLANEQNTLSNRMDTFTSLSSGSTTGDAELQDIRVGANGVTYPNAGDAVRGQYSQLKEDLVNLDILLDKGFFTISSDEIVNGRHRSDRVFVQQENRLTKVDAVLVKKGYTIKYNSANLQIAFGAYEKGSTTPFYETDWLLNLDYTIDRDCEILFDFRAVDNINISPSYYKNELFITLDTLYNSKITSDNLDGYTIEPNRIGRGGWYDANTIYDTRTNRVCYPQIEVNKGDVIRFSSDSMVYGYILTNKDGVIVTNTDINIKSDSHIVSDGYINFSFGKTDNSNILPSDFSASMSIEKFSNDNLLNTSENIELIQQVSTVANDPIPTHCLSLLQFSDIHGNQYNVNRIDDFYNKNIRYIDDIIHCGDTVEHNYEDPNVLDKYPSYLNVLGNHDCWKNGEDWYNATSKEAYNKFFKPYISNWNVVQPSNAETNGYCYYYKDYSDYDIRLIVLDCMHYDLAQNDWLVSILSDAKANNKSVIISSHYYAQTGVNKVESSFTTLEWTISYADGDRMERLPQSVFTTVQEFIDGGGQFICWLCGHSHFDYFGVVRQYTNQTVVIVESASYKKLGDSLKVKGTNTQDSFNVISFDTKHKLIKIVRIGNHYDSFMRSKRTLVYNYETHTLISNA